jgi:RND family efflux transporter MFP subunit
VINFQRVQEAGVSGAGAITVLSTGTRDNQGGQALRSAAAAGRAFSRRAGRSEGGPLGPLFLFGAARHTPPRASLSTLWSPLWRLYTFLTKACRLPPARSRLETSMPIETATPADLARLSPSSPPPAAGCSCAGAATPRATSTGTSDRGDVVEVVGATGTLEAVDHVQLGSQVSGTIQTLNADFNSTVKKGQVVARLDPSLVRGAARARRARTCRPARATWTARRPRSRTTSRNTRRAKELARAQLLPQSDLETAKANYDAAVAQLKANQAAESQAQANLNQAEVDLSHTIIATPIDGVVISRNVDVGQTVAASFQAPILFLIANDLTKMRVNASIDEADIGRVREGRTSRSTWTPSPSASSRARSSRSASTPPPCRTW